MAENSRIEWTDATWNPVVGCTRASSGCDNCYAVTMTKRLDAMGQPRYQGLVNVGKGHFNGTVRTVPEALLKPLSWMKPRRVFVNSMSDLFHKDVPFEFIDKVFAVMALTPQHTYQVLTKRPQRMAEYFNEGMFERGHESVLEEIDDLVDDASHLYDLGFQHKALRSYAIGDSGEYATEILCPLANVWLGTSVEDQATADERIPHLLQCPAAVRFLSCEPLLGPVDLAYTCFNGADSFGAMPGIHWLIVGGESGPNARPMDLEWVYNLVRQCQAASVPVFVKQLGKSFYHSGYRDGKDLLSIGPKGADWEHPAFPEGLKIREFPEDEMPS